MQRAKTSRVGDDPPDEYHAYARIADQSYKRVKTGLAIDGYTQLEEFKDAHHIVYRNNTTNDLVLGIRGTSDWSDVGTDVALGLGLLKMTSRYKKSEKKLKQLQQVYPNQKIILASHSLGATISEHLSHQYAVDAHLFNKGTNIYHTNLRDLGKAKKHKGNIHQYYVRGDLVSNSSILGSGIDHTYLIPKNPKSKNVHSIENFF